MKIPALLTGLWQKIKSAGTTPSTNRVFDGLWHRQWRIDDVGIHEFRRGHPHVSVYWADLAGFDGQKLRAINGAGSKVLLPKDRLAKFRAALYVEWQQRFPERFRANQARALRQLAWLAFLWLPLFYAAPCLFIYASPHFAMRRGTSTIDSFAYANRIALLSAVALSFVWIVYARARRKFRAAASGLQGAHSR